MVSTAELAQLALFSRFTAEDLQVVVDCMQRRRYAKGEVVFLQGDSGNTLYVVETGRIKIGLTSPDGKEMILALLGPSDFFGELAVLDGKPRSANAVAAEPSQLLLLHRPDFRRDLEARPRMAVELLSVLSERLRRDTEIVQDAAFLDVPGRLARVLLQLASEGEPGDGGTVIRARLTQSELAAMVGATRESVNKWLGFYQRRGVIRRDGGRITVLRPEGLRQRLY